MITVGNDTLLTTQEASTQSGLHADHIARLARQKRLQGVRVGKSWLVFASSLQQFARTPKRRPGPKPGWKSKEDTASVE